MFTQPENLKTPGAALGDGEVEETLESSYFIWIPKGIQEVRRAEYSRCKKTKLFRLEP